VFDCVASPFAPRAYWRHFRRRTFDRKVPESTLSPKVPDDAVTIVLVLIIVLGVGWLAAFFPARRGARVGPMRVLQSE
jgi:ABC-type lipoprotein release transport system permease subunit